jgi:hypothetical protein
VPETVTVVIEYQFPAMLLMRLEGDAVNVDELSRMLQQAKAGGVRAILESSEAIAEETFTWNSTTSGMRWNEGVWASAIGEE